VKKFPRRGIASSSGKDGDDIRASLDLADEVLDKILVECRFRRCAVAMMSRCRRRGDKGNTLLSGQATILERVVREESFGQELAGICKKFFTIPPLVRPKATCRASSCIT
jgi:hypothetical protein